MPKPEGNPKSETRTGARRRLPGRSGLGSASDHRLRTSDFTLRCLGVGDGGLCADRGCSAFLYRLGQATLLVDCGDGTARSYAVARLPADLIDHLFLSHLHADHAGGLPMLVQGLWLAGRRRDLPVHLPTHAIQPLRQLLTAANLVDEFLGFRLQLQPLSAAKAVRAGDVRVTPFPTSHLDDLRAELGNKYRQALAAYCFLIETGGLRVGHSADIGRAQDLAPLLAAPLDLLVCELAHVGPKELFAYLRGKPVRRVAFVHLADRHWRRLEQTRRWAVRMLPNLHCLFPHDGEEIAL